MNFRRASWLVLGAAFASSSTGFAQQRLPYDPRVQPTLPGGARPPAGGFTLTPPVVSYRGGSSATTATEATFATTLSGTAFEWTFGGGAIPNTATSTTPASPTVVLARPGTYTARVVARGPAGMREGSHAFVVNPFRGTSVSLATDPSLSRGESDRYSLLPGPGGDVSLLQCARVGSAEYTRLYARRRGVWTPFDVTARGAPTAASFSTTCVSPLGAMGSDGRIRFVARRGPTRLSYFSANTALPTSPAEWTESVIADDAATGARGVFTLRSDNRPMVSFTSGDRATVVKVAIANSSSPTGPKDWTTITPIPFLGTDLVMASNRDAPAVLFANRYDPPHPDNGVRLAYATTASPRTAADFRVVTLPRPTVGSPGIWGGQWAALACTRDGSSPPITSRAV